MGNDDRKKMFEKQSKKPKEQVRETGPKRLNTTSRDSRRCNKRFEARNRSGQEEGH